MLNKKLAGFLIIPAMIASVGASHAISNTASQTLQATLGSYVDITPVTSGAVTTTTIAPDTGNLAAAFVSKFQINLNTATQPLYLKATTASTTNPTEVAFFKQGANVYVVMANTAVGSIPLTAAVLDCKSATPTATNNGNAIAYPIASVALTNSGTSVYDPLKNQYGITALAGQTVATTTSGTTPYTNTYSYVDQAGTYQAILTLSTTSL